MCHMVADANGIGIGIGILVNGPTGRGGRLSTTRIQEEGSTAAKIAGGATTAGSGRSVRRGGFRVAIAVVYRDRPSIRSSTGSVGSRTHSTERPAFRGRGRRNHVLAYRNGSSEDFLAGASKEGIGETLSFLANTAWMTACGRGGRRFGHHGFRGGGCRGRDGSR